MQFNIKNIFAPAAFLLSATLLSGVAAAKGPPGLSEQALQELADAGVNKYLGDFAPASSEDIGNGWVKHEFDPLAGEGPVCITGTSFSAFTKQGNPAKLLIMLQGGGACWEGVPQCNLLAEAQEPNLLSTGIWDTQRKDNPFADYSVVYLPYCDGSVFGGDNSVVDDSFPGGVRHHRGLRNLSAGMDVAKAAFPNASRITVAGSSAGGVGAAVWTPFLTRFLYGNKVQQLTVFNDAGPIVGNPDAVAAAAARAADWRFDQFYPASCTECDALGQQSAIIKWRLDNDSTIREAFYNTDGDQTDRSFTSLNLPGQPPLVPFDPVNGVFGLSQSDYRALILQEHGAINAAHPKRYKRFIVSGDDSHTALQSPIFYSQTVDNVPLNKWTEDFVSPRPFWVDIVEEFIPLP